MKDKLFAALGVLGLVSVAEGAFALSVPYTETFSSGSAGWLDVSSVAVSLVAAGGADGGAYVTVTTNVVDSLGFGGQTLFRCNDSSNCSGDAFVGNWADGGVSTLRFAVRHNAATPLEFFARIATPFNFPAWAAESTTVAAPNIWTTVSFAISPSNPLLTPEFGTFAQTFANVGNFQLGVSVPTGFTASGVTFDLDSVGIAPASVPIPGAALLMMSAIGGLLGIARRA